MAAVSAARNRPAIRRPFTAGIRTLAEMKHTTTIGRWALGLAILAFVGCAQTDLARRFNDPPAAAKPHTW